MDPICASVLKEPKLEVVRNLLSDIYFHRDNVLDSVASSKNNWRILFCVEHVYGIRGRLGEWDADKDYDLSIVLENWFEHGKKPLMYVMLRRFGANLLQLFRLTSRCKTSFNRMVCNICNEMKAPPDAYMFGLILTLFQSLNLETTIEICESIPEWTILKNLANIFKASSCSDCLVDINALRMDPIAVPHFKQLETLTRYPCFFQPFCKQKDSIVQLADVYACYEKYIFTPNRFIVTKVANNCFRSPTTVHLLAFDLKTTEIMWAQKLVNCDCKLKYDTQNDIVAVFYDEAILSPSTELAIPIYDSYCGTQLTRIKKPEFSLTSHKHLSISSNFDVWCAHSPENVECVNAHWQKTVIKLVDENINRLFVSNFFIAVQTHCGGASIHFYKQPSQPVFLQNVTILNTSGTKLLCLSNHGLELLELSSLQCISTRTWQWKMPPVLDVTCLAMNDKNALLQTQDFVYVFVDFEQETIKTTIYDIPKKTIKFFLPSCIWMWDTHLRKIVKMDATFNYVPVAQVDNVQKIAHATDQMIFIV